MPAARAACSRPAAGIAVTGMVFYGQLASSHGDYATAFRSGIVSIAAFVAAALVLVLVDVLTGARERPLGTAVTSGAAGSDPSPSTDPAVAAGTREPRSPVVF